MKKYLCVIAVVLTPVVLSAQKTTFDYDKTATFANYKTYALKEGTPVGNELIDQRIIAAIDTQLATKGLKKADPPDVFVAYHVSFDKQKDISAWSTGTGPYGWGYGGGWGSTTTDVRVYEILVGTLVIDMADAKDNRMIWRGLGVREVDTEAKPEKRDKKINEAVTKILKNYPPKVKK
jgi:hypothetical protein